MDLKPSLTLTSSILEACTNSPVMAASRKQATPGNRIVALLILHPLQGHNSLCPCQLGVKQQQLRQHH